MEGHKSGWRIGNQNCESLRVNIDLPRHKIFRIMFHSLESLQGVHFLDLFFLCTCAYFTSLESNFKFFLFLSIQLKLMLLAWFDIILFFLLLTSLRAETSWFNHSGTCATLNNLIRTTCWNFIVFLWVLLRGRLLLLCLIVRALISFSLDRLSFDRGFVCRFSRAFFEWIANITVFLPDFLGYHEWSMWLDNDSIANGYNTLTSLFTHIR